MIYWVARSLGYHNGELHRFLKAGAQIKTEDALRALATLARERGEEDLAWRINAIL